MQEFTDKEEMEIGKVGGRQYFVLISECYSNSMCQF
jgi:hypothetical protein